MKFTVENLSEELFHAYQKNEPINWKESSRNGLNPVNAYRVQHAFNLKKGEPVKGYKISLTSEETQDLFHADSPLYGQIVASRIWKNGAELKQAEMNEPLLELELEFTVLKDLSPEDDSAALLEKTELAPGVETPDSRFKNWFPALPLELVISDSAVCGGVVVGDPAPKLPAAQLADIHAQVSRDGVPLTSGNATEVLGNPLNALKWLVQKLAQEGKTLKKGMTVSTGTFCMPKVLEKGHYEATFDHHVGDVVFDVR